MESYIGQRFGKLIIISNPFVATKHNHKRRFVTCKCDCGNIKDIELRSLEKGWTKSCGCLKLSKAKEFFIGKRFGKLVVLDFYDIHASPDGTTNYRWRCLCDCGNETIKIGSQLKRGLATNCGCESRKKTGDRVRTHGESKERLYKVWIGMKVRCCNINSMAYANYGGRGISICDEWLHDYLAFKIWAIQNGYVDGLTIERKDVNGNYCPENCTWITKEEQANNKRRNVLIEYNGEIHNIAQWSRITGIKYTIIRERIFKLGWPIEKALTIPNGAKRGEWNNE